MTVGVLRVLLPLTQAHADCGDQRRENIGERVHRIRHHGAGFAENARAQLEGGKQHVSQNADAGQFFNDCLLIHDRISQSLRKHK